MIEVEKSDELLTLRVRPRMPKTIDEEQGPRNHHQQGWQIHLAEEEICPKNRSHRSTVSGSGFIRTIRFFGLMRKFSSNSQ